MPNGKVTRIEVKKWINDCRINARNKGILDLEFIEVLSGVILDIVRDIRIDEDIKQGSWPMNKGKIL